MSKIDEKAGESWRAGSLARAALCAAASALLGSAALVLWNRRTLKSLLEADPTPQRVRESREDDGIY